MTIPYRKNSMMAMLDAKPEEKGNGEYWNDVNDHLSPIRRHLISTYLEVPDDEAMPLLGEYFGVALSFVALGALVRASNSTKRKQKKMIEEERLDLRSCSRFQRMALESMLKESMERLKTLSQNAYQMEEKVRDLVDENVALDKDKIQLLKRLAEAEKSVQELKALRRGEGRANEKVMCIVAAKEQDWLKEKRNLQKDAEKLKETVNSMTREAKLQARRCKSPICEHCKGIDKVVRTVKGKMSLRELNNLRESQGYKREVLKMGRELDIPKMDGHVEVEEDRVLMKSLEQKKKQSEQPGHLKNQNKVEKLMDWSDSLSTWRTQAGGIASGSDQSMSKDLLVKQQQDMECELANILKRVGMLKQRSYSSAGPVMRKDGSPMEEMQVPVEESEVYEHPKDGTVPELQQGEERGEKESMAVEPDVHDFTSEVAECASDQEDCFSVQDDEDSDYVELEKAFELRNLQEIAVSEEESHLASDNEADLGNLFNAITVTATGANASEGQQQPLDEDAEFAVFERSLELEEGGDLAGQECEGELLEGNHLSLIKEENPTTEYSFEEAGEADIEHEVEVTAENDGTEYTSPTCLLEEVEAGQSTQVCQELVPEARTDSPSADSAADGVDLQGNESLQECIASENAHSGDVEEIPDNCLAGDLGNVTCGVVESSDESEQLLEVVGVEDTDEFADASSCPLESVEGAVSEEGDPSAVHVSAMSGVDFQQNWDFKGCMSSAEENQDIPLFERNTVDDMAEELPEPEEKRVCGDSSAAGSIDEVLSSTSERMTCEDGESFKEMTSLKEFESEQKEDPVAEDIGLVATEKLQSDKVTEHGQDLEPTDTIPVSEFSI